MFLKYIELTGFKSFADRIKLEFHPGVTAIVGPNGCGKSNVLDAVRWVLGEQSARALRGREMADLIFNGTEKRKPLGMAEVLLTFSDCQGELGVEFSEVTVGRRVFRDGSSEYELNGKICRLKDIHDLFMDTGIGRAAYSIMEQGRINQLLSAKPEDRREVFEEAAGITKYKSQKRETLRKLEATDANLLRVTDIIKEVKRQLSSLQRQAAKARKYQEVFSELKLLEWTLAHLHWQQQSQAAETTKKNLSEKREQILKLQSVLQAAEEQSTTTRAALEKTETELEQARQRQLTGKTELQRIESHIGFNLEKLQSLDTADQLAQAEIAQLEERLKIQQQAAEATQKELAHARENAREFTAKLAEQQTLQFSTERTLQEARQRLSQERREQERLEAELGRLASELAARDADRRTALLRIETYENDSHDIRTARTFAEQQLNEKKAALLDVESAIKTAREKIQNLKESLQQAEAALAHTTAERDDAERRLVETQSRISILEALEKSHEGLTTGTQKLLDAFSSGRIRIPCAGILSEKIQIHPEATVAVERLLQGRFEALLLTSHDALWELAQWWKANGQNQRVWIAIQGGIAPPSAVAALPPESALRYITAPDELRPLIGRLLGDALIASDLAHARILRQHHPGSPIATREGDYLSREGVLEIAGERRLGKILERREEIIRLHGLLEELLQQRQNAEQAHATAVKASTQAYADFESAKEALRSQEKIRDEIAAEIRRAEQELQNYDRREQDIARQIQAIRDAEQQAESRFAQQTTRRAQIEALRATATQTLAELSIQLTECENQSSTVIAALTELRVQSVSLEEKRKSLEAQATTQRERLAELEHTLQSRRSQISENTRRRDAINEENTELRQQLHQLNEELQTLENTISELVGSRSHLIEQARATNEEERRQRTMLSALQDERTALEISLEKHTLALEAILERLARRYQLTAQDIARGPEQPPNYDGGTESISTRVAELNQIMDRIGPVNVEAISEFEELEAREKFLEEQFNDLTRSKEQLTKAIEQLNTSTHRMFAETFEKIKNNFQIMFSELFGGGKATIQLQDENDPLECGIDIIAKPPGKEPKSIVSLSGGEQTMTAVALMFAIYMVKPSPFCILDEMDAPLDESNINRFLNILRRFTSQSQFLLITHNKRTIAFADALYGVTQEESGVSKVVSVRFTPTKSSSEAQQSPQTKEHEPITNLVTTSDQHPETTLQQQPAQHSFTETQTHSPTLNPQNPPLPLPGIPKAQDLSPQKLADSPPMDITQPLPGSQILRRINSLQPPTKPATENEALKSTLPLARLSPIDPNAALVPPKTSKSPRPVFQSGNPVFQPQKQNPPEHPQQQTKKKESSDEPPRQQPIAGFFKRFGKKNSPKNDPPPTK